MGPPLGSRPQIHDLTFRAAYQVTRGTSAGIQLRIYGYTAHPKPLTKNNKKIYEKRKKFKEIKRVITNFFLFFGQEEHGMNGKRQVWTE